METKKGKYNIIIDTDPGTDDALAIAVASVWIKSGIRAMISTYGNVDGNQTYRNLINLAALLDIRCDILQGALCPLDQKTIEVTNFHGTDGLCGVTLPNADAPNLVHDSIEKLYEIIKEYGNIKYIAIGPLTNLATLICRFPDAGQYIDEVIIMGGGFSISNVEHDAEYNFSMDAKAVQNVLQSPLKKVIAPLDMTHKNALSITEIEQIIGSRRDESDELGNKASVYEIMSQLLFKNYDTCIAHGEEGAIIHDAATLAYLLDSTMCRIKEAAVSADDHGAVRFDSDGNRNLVKIIETLDKDFFVGMLRSVFENF